MKENPNYEDLENDVFLLKQTCNNVEGFIQPKNKIDKKKIVLDCYDIVFPNSQFYCCSNCLHIRHHLIDFLCETKQVSPVSNVKKIVSFLKNM